MRRLRLSPRDRRAVLAGALVLAPGLAWAFAARPYLDAVADARDRVHTGRALLAREQALLAEADSFPARFETGAGLLMAAAPRLLGGEDDGEAGAALAGYVRRLAGLSRTHLVRLEPSVTRDAGGGLTALPLEVSGEGDLEGILTLVELLETGPKLVHVQGLSLDGGASSATAAVPAYSPYLGVVPEAQPQSLSFRLSLVGFSLTAEGAAPVASAADSSALPSLAEEGEG